VSGIGRGSALGQQGGGAGRVRWGRCRHRLPVLMGASRPASSACWRSELLQQHRQRFTQLEPVAGGVCEEESALSNKAAILDSSAASRSLSFFSSFKPFSNSRICFSLSRIRFSLSSASILSCYGFAGLRLRSLLDVVDGTPVEHRQQAPPGRQGGDIFRSGYGPGVCGSGRVCHRRSSW